MAPSGAGLIFTPVPASPASTAGGGDSPVTVGFSTVWPSLTTKVPCVLTQTAVYCRMYGIPPHGSFIPVTFWSNLHDYLFVNKLTLKSTLGSVIFYTQLNSPSIQQD